ncbi:hypothetical protein PHLCEN_2v1611 [Hermanssonia centrifuga]|uniref:Uncharacterized protein n=1 Tax=Hermanssonia centrifuga TaxID=98765 RepID=A0A2R6RZL9_9APHY|nr:hypothetical protein PHLCEN_2v1611 [Hermanssonia centrifuga]
MSFVLTLNHSASNSSANAFAIFTTTVDARETYETYEELRRVTCSTHVQKSEHQSYTSHSACSSTSTLFSSPFGILESSHNPREKYMECNEFGELHRSLHRPQEPRSFSVKAGLKKLFNGH